MNRERAAHHDPVAKRSGMQDDHWRLGQKALGYTADRKAFIPEILLPQMRQHVAGMLTFQLNGRALATDIHHTEMIIFF